MNSKERVQAAIARQPVDRVPLGFYTVDYDIFERVLGHKTYVRNKIATQIAFWEGRRAEVAESLKKDTVEFYRKMDCADLILPKEAPLLPPADYDPNPPQKIAEDTWQDRDGRILKAAWDTNEIACVYDPNAGKHIYTAAEFEGPLDLTPPARSRFEAIDYVYEQLGDERYIASTSAGFDALVLLGGMEQGLMMYGTDPDVVVAAGRRYLAAQNALDQYYIHEGAPGVLFEDDFAGTNGPLISPRMFREICLPILQGRVRDAKHYAPQVILHSCGQSIPLVPMFIEAGIDCYESLQTTAGMEIGRLKTLFGERLALWGGVPVEDLIGGTPEDVRRDVRLALERGAPGGGFILGPSHSIAKNTKYDNFMAMVDEFVKLRDKF